MREIVRGERMTRSIEPPVAKSPPTWPSSWTAVMTNQVSLLLILIHARFDSRGHLVWARK